MDYMHGPRFHALMRLAHKRLRFHIRCSRFSDRLHGKLHNARLNMAMHQADSEEFRVGLAAYLRLTRAMERYERICLGRKAFLM